MKGFVTPRDDSVSSQDEAVARDAAPLTPGPSPLSTGERGAREDTDASAEERSVAGVLDLFQQTLTSEEKDILALATAFRQPPTEARLLEYLVSEPVRHVLHDLWKRDYLPFAIRPAGWLQQQLDGLVHLRLLERVGLALDPKDKTAAVIDAHPLVRRGFEGILGSDDHRRGAGARAGFLRGRPDRRPPTNLDEAREEVELFHAYCDAGLWNEADGAFVALDNPKHRFLAPAFERDLLLRFFPNGDRRQPPLWEGFGRHRSLAISLEMLGEFNDAIEVYRPADAPLRGDALIALGRLQPFLDTPHAAHPWQMLWHCYRAHALALLGRTAEALDAARSALPMDIYEWVHVFECLLRLGRLDLLDVRSLLYRQPLSVEHRWTTLARRRMDADYRRVTGADPTVNLDGEYRDLIENYDRGGLPFERALTRLSYGRLLLAHHRHDEAASVAESALTIARRDAMVILEADAAQLRDDGNLRLAGSRGRPLEGTLPPRP